MYSRCWPSIQEALDVIWDGKKILAKLFSSLVFLSRCVRGKILFNPEVRGSFRIWLAKIRFLNCVIRISLLN